MNIHNGLNIKPNTKEDTTVQSRRVDNNSSSSHKATTLENNQVIKGEVVDIRANEISIKLSANEIITAKLYEPSELTIGQKASFVVENASEPITVRLIIDDQKSSEDPTLQKALKAAGLPINNKNLLIVQELLNNQMPIDKQTINLLLKQSYIYKNASIETLVLMNKNNLPITKENIAQFEEYRNYEHRIIKEVESISKDFSELSGKLSQTINTNDKLINFNNKLLEIITSKDYPKSINLENTTFYPQAATTENNATIQPAIPTQDTTLIFNNLNTKSEVNLNTLNDIINKESTYINNSTDKSTNPLNELLTNKEPTLLNGLVTNKNLAPLELNMSSFTNIERDNLIKALSQYSLPESLKGAIIDGSATLRELSHVIEQAKEPSQKQDTLLSTGKESTSFLDSNQKTPPNDVLLKTPIVEKLLQSFNEMQRQNYEIAAFTTPNERADFIKVLEKFQFPKNIIDQITKGEITSDQLLNLIKDKLPLMKQEDLKEFFNNKVYQTLIQEELTRQWTLTTKTLTQKGEVDNLYNKMYDQLNKMDNLMKDFNLEQNSLSNNTSHLKENIDFMKTLNEIYTYVQLPLKLKEQNIHSDLYVFTNKKSLKKNQDDISILLHLDMEHLGSIDIHLQLTKKNVLAKFYLEDNLSKKIIAENIDTLEDALLKKGFQLNSEILTREKKVDFVEDFIERERPNSSLQRYSFDVRG